MQILLRKPPVCCWHLFICLTLLILSGCGGSATKQDNDPQTPFLPACVNPAMLHGQYDPRAPRYIVVYKEGTDSQQQTDSLAKKYGFTPFLVFGSGFSAELTKETVAALRCEASVKFIEYNQIVAG